MLKATDGASSLAEAIAGAGCTVLSVTATISRAFGAHLAALSIMRGICEGLLTAAVMSTEKEMKTFDFRLTLANADRLDDDLERRVLEAGMDDATLGISFTVGHLDFSRAAASLGEAVRSALQDARKAGLDVQSITIEDVDALANTIG